MKQMTKTGHTETANGVIPHLIIGGGELRAPVKIDIRNGATMRTLGGAYVRPAVVREGRYVHALPGGGEVLGSCV